MNIIILLSTLSFGAKAGSLGWGLAFKYTMPANIFIGTSGFWAGTQQDEYLEACVRTGYTFYKNEAVMPYAGFSGEYYKETHEYWAVDNKKEVTLGIFAGIIFIPYYNENSKNTLSLEPETTFEMKNWKNNETLFHIPGFGFSIYYNIGKGGK